MRVEGRDAGGGKRRCGWREEMQVEGTDVGGGDCRDINWLD